MEKISVALGIVGAITIVVLVALASFTFNRWAGAFEVSRINDEMVGRFIRPAWMMASAVVFLIALSWLAGAFMSATWRDPPKRLDMGSPERGVETESPALQGGVS